jgi:hypothetical protein
MKYLRKYEQVENTFNDKNFLYAKNLNNMFFDGLGSYEIFPYPYEDDMKGMTVVFEFNTKDLNVDFFRNMANFLDFTNKYEGDYSFQTNTSNYEEFLSFEVDFTLDKIKEIEKILIKEYGMEGHPDTLNYNL